MSLKDKLRAKHFPIEEDNSDSTPSTWWHAVIGAALLTATLTPRSTSQHDVNRPEQLAEQQITAAAKPDTVFIDKDHADPTSTRPAYSAPEPAQRFSGDRIPILMYHKIGRPEDRYTVAPERLRSQLDRLHEQGYYCVSLDDYLTADFDDVPRGKQPVVLTFDDAHPSQFQLKADGEPTPSSAVGILENAFKKHDAFGDGATFYVSYAGDDNEFRHPFGGDENTKLSYLDANGYTVGYHTPFHADNEHADPGDIDEQTTILNALLAYNADEPSWKHYAHPYGATPERPSTREALRTRYTSAVKAWGGFAPHPRSPAFNPYDIPRVETNATTFPRILERPSYEVEP